MYRRDKVPEVFGLKLVSFNASYDSLLTIHHFPINLQHKEDVVENEGQFTVQLTLESLHFVCRTVHTPEG